MWLLRPRVVREFRNHLSTVRRDEPYFMSVVNSVDRVHDDPILKKFWRKGQLVVNKKYLHPYQVNIPGEYGAVDRWFLLDTDLDPKRPWDLNTVIPVFALAMVMGEKPNREWLIYAHSPLKDRNNVQITVPGYGQITVNVSAEGSFYSVKEKGKQVLRIVAGGSTRLKGIN
jgi:hypothetical protein